MRILLFSEITLFKYNVSTILSPIAAFNVSTSSEKLMLDLILDFGKETRLKVAYYSFQMRTINFFKLEHF